MSLRIFGHDRHRCDDPWAGAPAYELEQAAMLFVLMLQNEAILAKLEQRSNNLSPKDQATVDEIWKIEQADARKIDAALDGSPAHTKEK